jgi:hypothetical protein
LTGELREGVGIEYLSKVYTRYINLVENSELLSLMKKKDKLLMIDPKFLSGNSPSSSMSSNGYPDPLAIDVEM